MSGQHAFFVRDAELSQRVGAMFHDVPIGLTTHDYGDHLLSLSESESGLAVVVAQTVRHAYGKAEANDSIEKGDDLFRSNRVAQETAAEIIGAESFGRAFGPNFDAAVGHHFESESVTGGFAD